MILEVQAGWLKAIKHAKAGDFGHKQAEALVSLPHESFTPEQLDRLFVLGEKAGTNRSRICQRIKVVRQLLGGEVETIKVTRLAVLADAITAFLRKNAPNFRLYQSTPDGHLLPWYVSKVSFSAGSEYGRGDPYVSISLQAVRHDRGVTDSCVFHADALPGTVSGLLQEKGYLVETPEANAQLVEDYETLRKLSRATGSQHLAEGAAKSFGRWDRNTVEMIREGRPSQVVLDGSDQEWKERGDKGSALGSSRFWTGKKNKHGDDDDEGDDDQTVALPVQPYVRVFVFYTDDFAEIHVRNLKPYPYDLGVMDKLVIDEKSKRLVSLLILGTGKVLEDIVRGKTGGTVVLLTGPPGTGKTLTAEAASEALRRPLYAVQCSQLGVDPASIEKELMLVLDRAMRWGAILLIDEADVYVAHRGQNIHQNAIVGVFLRVLERYRGILFFTSNKGVVIDDAILSRTLAWVHYRNPDQGEREAIWRILAKQYEVKLSAEDVATLGRVSLSGRNIKHALKLARMLTEKPGVEDIETALQYLAVDRGEEEAGR